MAKNSKLSNDRELFDSFFPGLVDDIVKEGENDKETGDALRHMREVGKQLIFTSRHKFAAMLVLGKKQFEFSHLRISSF